MGVIWWLKQDSVMKKPEGENLVTLKVHTCTHSRLKLSFLTLFTLVGPSFIAVVEVYIYSKNLNQEKPEADSSDTKQLVSYFSSLPLGKWEGCEIERKWLTHILFHDFFGQHIGTPPTHNVFLFLLFTVLKCVKVLIL